MTQMPKLFAILSAATIGLVMAIMPASAQSPGERGHVLLKELCASCHAVEKTGDSPHAAAPTFRKLGNSFDLDRFAARLQRGLEPGHPDMPAFKFNEEDARAAAAYLRSIQQ
jgi:mono/diheme cytochrome c family protein